MSNEITTIADLLPDPRNARKHNPRNIGTIVDSMQTVGAARSIVIDEAGVILAGNGAVEAAGEAGITKVQVIDADGETIIAVRRTGLTDAQKMKLALADNRTSELAEWNEEELARQLKELDALGEDVGKLGWSEKEYRELSGGEASSSSNVSEVPDERETDIVRGDMFQLGQHVLLCGDSTNRDDVLRVLGARKADMVFTSPPYAVGVDYGTYDDTIENLRAMLPILADIWMNVVVVPGGFAVINYGDIISGRVAADTEDVCEYPMAVEYWPVFRAAGWNLWTRRIVTKPIFATYSPWVAQSSRAAANWEHMWIWKSPGEAIVSRSEYSASGVWTYEAGDNPEVSKETHGAAMASRWARMAIETHSRQDGIVFEPFNGTGTTIIAGEQSGRSVHAIDIEPKYVQITIDRWESYTGGKAVKIDD